MGVAANQRSDAQADRSQPSELSTTPIRRVGWRVRTQRDNPEAEGLLLIEFPNAESSWVP
jgi:hypothetical protein